jgi:ribonuclease HII
MATDDLPDYSIEAALTGPVCGVDEAGRGPWAGPVIAAAVILNPACTPDGIDDSKRLSERQREQLYDAIMVSSQTGIGAASVAEIDRLNILHATLLAMARAVSALPVAPSHALIDGNRAPALPCPATTLIRGDGRSLSIAAASILAKVYRDRLMRELARQFPAYGWEQNKGYGTERHRIALGQAGVSPHHRLSFAPVLSQRLNMLS